MNTVDPRLSDKAASDMIRENLWRHPESRRGGQAGIPSCFSGIFHMKSLLSCYGMKKTKLCFRGNASGLQPEPHKFITSCSPWFHGFSFSPGLTQLPLSCFWFNRQYRDNNSYIITHSRRLFSLEVRMQKGAVAPSPRRK